jgi:hypothetical protein
VLIHLQKHDLLFVLALVISTALALLGAWKLVEVVVFDAPWVCAGLPGNPQAGSAAGNVLRSIFKYLIDSFFPL